MTVQEPGWYSDPIGAGPRRYWDGVAWTGYTADLLLPGRRARGHFAVARVAAIVAVVAMVALVLVLFAFAGNDRPLTTLATVTTVIASAVFVVAVVVATTEWIVATRIRESEIRTAESAAAPPGWYRDPDVPSQARYWNGATWSEDAYDAAGTKVVNEAAASGRMPPERPPAKPALRRPRMGCGHRVLMGLAGLFVLVLVVSVALAVWSRLHPPAEYGYSTADRTEYRITRLLAEQRPQPWVGSRGDLRDYLRRSGAGCRSYSEHSYGPQPEAWMFGHEEWAECTGRGAYILRTYTDSPGKRADINNRAHCGGSPDSDLAPFKARFWIEGPNWVVEMVSGLRTDVRTTEINARRTANDLKAPLYRSCAPGQVRRVSIGQMFPYTGGTVVVDSFQDPYAWPNHAPRDGFKYVAVSLTVTPATGNGSFLSPEMAIHDDGTEIYYEPALDSPLDSVATLSGPQASGLAIFAIPDTVQQPLLRLSWINPWYSDSPASTALADIVLRP